ncbi:MAG: hypothetical protein EOO05_01630 [Chitinophagaceae bacterium]|nr:MAG: hypothetical protein EOO05_01630 [Chitinophagaceae bacterium]
MKLLTPFFLCFVLGLNAQNRPLKIWFDKPAAQWEETLPLGNGRLGMTPDGGVEKERIVLNDITMWSGGPQDANNYNAWKQLPAIRKLVVDALQLRRRAEISAKFLSGEWSTELAGYERAKTSDRAEASDFATLWR